MLQGMVNTLLLIELLLKSKPRYGQELLGTRRS